MSQISKPIALDASVMLNLAATDSPMRILSLVGSAITVDEAAQELVRNPRTRRPVSSLSDVGLDGVVVVKLGPEERVVMHRFSSPPHDLDDGEAAVIAHAHVHGLTMYSDDKRAYKVAKRVGLSVKISSTVDLFRVAAEVLKEKELSDMVYDALRFARMGVVSLEDAKWVADLIGRERASECYSLPAKVRG